MASSSEAAGEMAVRILYGCVRSRSYELGCRVG